MLGLPFRGIAELLELLHPSTGRAAVHAFNAIGQVEGVGARALVSRVLREEQFLERGGVRAPIAHEPVRDGILFDAGGLAQAFHHDLLAHADAETTGDDLVEHEELHALQSGPRGLYANGFLCFILVLQVLHVVHPLCQALGDGPFQLSDVRHRFREVAHHVVAGLEQPVGDAADLGGPLPQLGAGDRPFRSPAAEQRDGPQLVAVRRFAEIGRQRIHLGVGGGGGVERIEELGGALHALGYSGA